jgi:uncharacterized membrane protein YkgB
VVSCFILLIIIQGYLRSILSFWNHKDKETEMDPFLQQQNQNQPSSTTVIVNQTEKSSNGVGIAGFILALLGVIFSWIPILNWILWIIGLILSFVGVFKKPKGFAIAGLCLSLLGIILIIAVIGTIGALFSLV